MAFKHALAGDSWLPIADGVKHVRELEEGDEVVIVRPDGTIGSSRVKSMSVNQPTPCTSLLTSVGELLVPAGTRIVTRAGAETAEAIRDAVAGGDHPRVEIVQPSDVLVARHAGPRKSAYLSATLAFPRPRIVIPGWLERESDVCTRIEAVLGTAGVRSRRHSLEDWCVFDFDVAAIRPASGAWPRADAHLDALTLFAAWSLDGDHIAARVLDGEVSYLQRLCGCLASNHRQFEVKWLPGYWPVEARVHGVAATPLGSYVSVLRTVVRQQSVCDVEVAQPGAIVVGLAMLR